MYGVRQMRWGVRANHPERLRDFAWVLASDPLSPSVQKSERVGHASGASSTYTCMNHVCTLRYTAARRMWWCHRTATRRSERHGEARGQATATWNCHHLPCLRRRRRSATALARRDATASGSFGDEQLAPIDPPKWLMRRCVDAAAVRQSTTLNIEPPSPDCLRPHLLAGLGMWRWGTLFTPTVMLALV